jgi:uncharacterized protein
MSGRVVHFEIPVDDAQRAQSFYAEVFDWQVRPMPEVGYTGLVTGPTGEDGIRTEPGFINGGMASRDEIPGGGPVVTIGVEDIDATLARVQGNGGTVVQERMAVADMGFAAYIRDCEGNVVGLWQDATG